MWTYINYFSFHLFITFPDSKKYLINICFNKAYIQKFATQELLQHTYLYIQHTHKLPWSLVVWLASISAIVVMTGVGTGALKQIKETLQNSCMKLREIKVKKTMWQWYLTHHRQ